MLDCFLFTFVLFFRLLSQSTDRKMVLKSLDIPQASARGNERVGEKGVLDCKEFEHRMHGFLDATTFLQKP